MGGTSNDIGRSLVLDASANIYLAGEFSLTVDFDPSLATVNMTSAGSNDIFLPSMMPRAIMYMPEEWAAQVSTLGMVLQ
jgi:hypothetical protein